MILCSSDQISKLYKNKSKGWWVLHKTTMVGEAAFPQTLVSGGASPSGLPALFRLLSICVNMVIMVIEHVLRPMDKSAGRRICSMAIEHGLQIVEHALWPYSKRLRPAADCVDLRV